jgi:hypothetical protein
MLQPENYPRMLGQALVFEPDPFVEMADDNNPWVEGLFFTAVIGFVVAIAQIIGGILLTAVLPNPTALLEAFVQMLRQMQTAGLPAPQMQALEVSVRQWWPLLTAFYSYGTGWARLLLLLIVPILLIGQWLLYGVISHVTARALGGSGSLSQTLGVTALAAAPRVLMLVTVFPFATVSALLLQVWGVLIAYRGLEIAHDLGVRRAAIAALVPVLLFALLAMIMGAFFGTILTWIGGSL